MALENCSTCGRVFNRTHRDVCPACWEKEQGLVDQIADFLNTYPKAGPDEILAKLDVPQAEIVRLLRRGRLMGYDQLGAFLTCERCGARVDRGTLCAACRAVVLELAGPPKEEGEGEADLPPGRPGAPPGKTGPLRPAPPATGSGTANLPRSNIGTSREDFWQNRAR